MSFGAFYSLGPRSDHLDDLRHAAHDHGGEDHHAGAQALLDDVVGRVQVVPFGGGGSALEEPH